MRVLLETRADVHEMDVIGWAAIFGGRLWSRCCSNAARATTSSWPSRSAIWMRFEQSFGAIRGRSIAGCHGSSAVLIALGADLEAQDGSGQTAMTVAMLRVTAKP